MTSTLAARSAGVHSWEGLTPPYSTIVVDPPWPYDAGWPGWSNKQRRPLPYSAMELEEIAELEVRKLAVPAAHLYLWTTNRYLEDAFGIVRVWGFSPTTTLVWCKESRGPGPGGAFAITTEFVIHARAPANPVPREVQRAGALIRAAREAVGYTKAELHHRVRGGKRTGLVSNWEADLMLPNERDWRRLQELLPGLVGVKRPVVEPPPPRSSTDRTCTDTTWWKWPRGAHSEKPAAFLDVVEQVSPGPYVELFARQPRLGWDSWGWGYE